jgi:hypothetical protein
VHCPSIAHFNLEIFFVPASVDLKATSFAGDYGRHCLLQEGKQMLPSSYKGEKLLESLLFAAILFSASMQTEIQVHSMLR